MEMSSNVRERSRLQTLQSYQILDTPPEVAFDDLVQLAAQICSTPIAAITLVDERRQWFKACLGLPMRESDRARSFCDYTIRDTIPLVIPDAQQDPRFAQNPWVLGKPYLRFYAGVPLIALNGDVLGTLTVMDQVPRTLTTEQLSALQMLARQVVNQLELRLFYRKQGQAIASDLSTEIQTEGLLQEELLQDSDEGFHRLISSAATGIVMCHPDGTCIQANPAFCQTVGYNEEELIERNLLLLIHPDDSDDSELIDQLLAGELDSFVLEKRLVKKDGSTAWVRASVSCIRSRRGEPLYVMAITEDISERINVQAIATSLEQQLAFILDNMTDAFYLLDREWRFTYINHQAERLVQRTLAELLNRVLWDEFQGAPQFVIDKLHYAAQEQEPTHFEFYYSPLEQWFEVHAYPSSTGMAIYFRIITERKQTVEELRASEERFNIVARTTNDAIWDWNLLTDKIWWSEGLQTLFGHTIEGSEADITSWINYTHPEDREWVLQDVQNSIDHGDTHWIGEYRFIRKDGSTAYVLDRAFLIYNEEGQPIRMVGSLIDLTERKNAEEALRASEERFRTMAETIDDVFWTWDVQEDRVLYVSPRYESLFGSSREALYQDATSFQRNIHPDDLLRLQAAEQADPYSIELEYRLLLPNEQIRWIGIRTFPVRDATGQVIHLVGVGRDITLLVETREQLRASEQQYRMLFKNNPQPMWVYDWETLAFLAVNDATIDHYGYSEAEFLTMSLRDIRPAEDVPRLEESIATATQRTYSGLWRHFKKDGTMIDVETSSDGITFNGRRARIVLANDVTAQLQAEAQVREQAALLDKAQDAIMVRDLNHRITYWNHGAERLYGWSATEVIGRHVDELLYKEQAAYQKVFNLVLENGEWFGELQQVDKQGRDLLIEAHWTLVRDQEGNPRSIFSINTDITERKHLEAQFLRAQRIESIGALAGGIAHDINNVLAPILLALTMLKQKPRTASELKLLTIMEDSAKHGADMVRQVLSFARGVEGQHTAINLSQIIQELDNLISDTFDRRIRLQINIEENLPPILGDPTQIHQVLLNLCVNARDAMPNGGELKLSITSMNLETQQIGVVGKTRSYVVIKVTDTGIGIPRAIQDRIFEPFFTTKEVGKGTGLGLPTVQAVLKSHGGFIHLDSQEGSGTEFTIYLPSFEEDSSHNRLLTIPPTYQSGGEMILVVDDDDGVRFITRETLAAFGYQVLTAVDGAEALALYSQHQQEIALVLTDMMMPGMDGFATIQNLRQINPQVKIIAVSGLVASETLSKAASMGIKHFLQKPYGAEILINKIAEALAEES